MKKYLISNEGKFYKANMHSHSTVSDGSYTPEQLKDIYKTNGYSVLAVTDHDYLVSHNDLSDDDFIFITACELNVSDKNPTFDLLKCSHINIYSKDPNFNKQIYFHPECMTCLPWEERLKLEHIGEYRHREYSISGVNAIIKEARDNGFLVCFNHPQWSLEDFEQYIGYEGYQFFEIYNNGSYLSGHHEHNEYIYDLLLRNGKRVACIAADDNHNRKPVGDVRFDSFGGFIMIKATELKYDKIFESLEKGEFYASCGPEIYNLFVEDNKVYISCSNAKEISISTSGRRAQRSIAAEGEHLNFAVFDIKETDGYIRLQVMDECGKFAYTRAYFLDEI